jgi:hypothetical protein
VLSAPRAAAVLGVLEVTMQGPYQTLPGQTVKLVPPHRKARRRRSTTPDFHAGKRALTEKGTGGDVDGLKAAVSGGEEHRGQLMRPTTNVE